MAFPIQTYAIISLSLLPLDQQTRTFQSITIIIKFSVLTTKLLRMTSLFLKGVSLLSAPPPPPKNLPTKCRFSTVFKNKKIVQHNMYLNLMKNKNLLMKDLQSNLFLLFRYMNAFQKSLCNLCAIHSCYTSCMAVCTTCDL